ncbi:1-phosphatidylinositol 4,5-bisphosphate phosphodiesterase epsilon-1 [Frankliniella fusca]|uniref:1-phosphatidylinositol 4,5-bisphosphate phosphodiesterase epsilon-1 n=1 Tax=Frankliniella fusca TaxID=407009 RepID=A0AAE1GY64_9NEOP|nr:1-phosphatidylinositol 4,5-bisphosphate phosphodiesterase epsilon-1 [Frankliniella fusca]
MHNFSCITMLNSVPYAQICAELCTMCNMVMHNILCITMVV